MKVVLKRSLLRGLIEMYVALNPFQVLLCPRIHSVRLSASVPQKELAQPMPGPELILFSRLAGADQIAQCLMSLIGNPNRGQIAGTMAASQFLGIAAVRLHPLACLYRNQGGRHYLAFHAQRSELPVEYITGRARFVTGPKFFHRSQLTDHLPD